MGGYGVLSAAGAGLAPTMAGKTLPGENHPASYLASRSEGDARFEAQDPRIKAVAVSNPVRNSNLFFKLVALSHNRKGVGASGVNFAELEWRQRFGGLPGGGGK